MIGPCAVPDCGRAVSALGLCSSHYKQAAHGWPEFRPIRATYRGGATPYRTQCAPCGACGAPTRARGSYRGDDGLRLRICACGRTSEFRRTDGGGLAFVRTLPHREEMRKYPPECGFPECGRPRVRGVKWCQGHDKQKDRHGVAAMRPLWDRSSPEFRAYMRSVNLGRKKPRRSRAS